MISPGQVVPGGKIPKGSPKAPIPADSPQTNSSPGREKGAFFYLKAGLLIALAILILISGICLSYLITTGKKAEPVLANKNITERNVSKEETKEVKVASSAVTKQKELGDMVEWKFEGNVLIKYLGLESELSLPEGITGINEKVFQNKMDLVTVKIPDGVCFIGSSAFQNCKNLKNLTLPKSLEKIDDYAFAGCLKLQGVELPENITSIGSYAFCRCSSITEWKLPRRLLEIGAYAFMGNTKIVELELPSGVERIGKYAFQGCSQLQKITIPETIKEIGEHVFSMCSSELEIICEENSRAHEYALQNGIRFTFS